ncbi:MAG: hypothetical protein M1480_11505 [Bacteroidetes bacterium]|nr:hypothetical protein [Bacteroidota bacterium]
MKVTKYIVLISIVFLLVQCSNPVSSPPFVPIEKLLSAPDTISIEGKNIYLSTFMWRDFMPISPPDGKSLIVIAKIETVDSSKISSSIIADAIYIVNDNQVWKSYLRDESPGSDLIKPYRIVKIARDGPKWGPRIYVDVVVRLRVNLNIYLLKASKQYIGATY